jgi:hypothetical protein
VQHGWVTLHSWPGWPQLPERQRPVASHSRPVQQGRPEAQLCPSGPHCEVVQTPLVQEKPLQQEVDVVHAWPGWPQLPERQTAVESHISPAQQATPTQLWPSRPHWLVWHTPLVQAKPLQHGTAAVHCWPGWPQLPERQMPVASHIREAQQGTPPRQLCPSGLHCVDWQSPPAQVAPTQQGRVAPQVCPGWPQPEAPHVPFASQESPEQHGSPRQLWPSALHEADWHTPLAQAKPAQQESVPPHCWPGSPQLPERHSPTVGSQLRPAQQESPPRQLCPSGLHAELWQAPLRQE